jgi:two-component sensor histidine kinase
MTALKVIYASFIFFAIPYDTHAQIFDGNRQQPYQKVFIETDDFDSTYLHVLEENWHKPHADTVRFSMLHDLAYYTHTRNLNASKTITEHGLALTKNNPLWYGRFQITLGSILLRMEKLDTALAVLEDAQTKVEPSDLPFLNTQLGYVYERKGELGRAADYAQQSMRLGELLGDNKAIALAYSDLSNIFWKQSKFQKGLEYGLKSIEIFEQRGIKDLDYDFTLYVVGNNYLELGQYRNAINYYKQAIAVGLQYGFYNNLSDVYISLVELNATLKDFAAAQDAGNNAVKYAKLLENDFMIMRSWLAIGKMQYLNGKYQDAIKSLSTSINVATADFGDEYFLSQAYEALSKAYAKTGNYVLAYNALLKFDALEDQIFTSEADLRISQLQTEYDVAIKESTIKLQKTRLAQQRTQQTIILIITGFLLITMIILYRTHQINKKKNKLLEKQNMEKEFLLKEIHHRVKNNLEIVSGLLSLQSAQISDKVAVEMLQESQNRVQSMGIIHQKLYQGTNLATIEMREYFQNLGTHVLDSFGMGNKITIQYHMEKIDLDIDTAVPLGLIVNELFTNALKYAFTGKKKGLIELKLEKQTSNKLQLQFSDDGVGLKPEGKIKGTGFGKQLINLLCQQLNAKMSQHSENGTAFICEFEIYGNMT